ncbi:MAG: HEAT repeat domain-containing protein [Proteobacteria bacterium]|jgi:hypothetical protein|nr:HEAT repeat domain-containing protein [Pseudomonadota bacterium]
MSIFNAIRRFFKPTPAEKTEKLRRRVVNMYGNADERRYAIVQLSEMGPELAPRPLIERFTCRCENGTIDADEKELTKNLLVNLGTASIEPLKSFLRNNDKDFNWPYRTLSELLTHEELVNFLVELLDSIGPEYVRDPERKEQLMLVLKSFKEDRICKAILPYLGDDNETIRFVAADTVIEQAHEDGIRALAERMTKENSQRVLTLIATAFRDKGWLVDESLREDVEKNLPAGFRINSKGMIL